MTSRVESSTRFRRGDWATKGRAELGKSKSRCSRGAQSGLILVSVFCTHLYTATYYQSSSRSAAPAASLHSQTDSRVGLLLFRRRWRFVHRIKTWGNTSRSLMFSERPTLAFAFGLLLSLSARTLFSKAKQFCLPSLCVVLRGS